APIKGLYELGVEIEENSELDLLVSYKEHANDPRIPATGLFAARFAKIVHGDTEKDNGAGSPVTAAGLTFADGLNFAYPDDPATVSADPRTTHGFRDRIRKDTPASGWSVPFRKEYTKDSHTHLTGSVRIAADPGAVLYLDLDISRLMQSIRNAKSLQDFADEMTFVDRNGRIILTGRNGVLNEPEKLDAIYPDPMLLERIRHYENGYFTFMREIDDSLREMVCVFSKCQTLGMFYLEIYDMETLLDNFESGRIKKH
ncbi:MAG: cache domain-containing protein, partial [Lentisphaeria bacterium]|nr:cache domain-containing protein [Lentisphaeria bacterium]